MDQLIGCCGLNCETCDARIATITDDGALREKTAALWTELNGVTITPEMIHCTGCRVGGRRRLSATSSARYITASGRRNWRPAPTACRWRNARRWGALLKIRRRSGTICGGCAGRSKMKMTKKEKT